MAFVATNFTTFDPTLLEEPKTPILGQVESQAYNRLSRDNQLALADVRRDVDDGFGRLASLGVVDRDNVEPTMFGPYYVAGPIDPGDDADVLKIWGEVRGEKNRTAQEVYEKAAPVAAYGTLNFTVANSDLLVTARNPGNGTDDYPTGNRTILRFIDPFVVDPIGGIDQSLEITSDVVEILGRKWLCIQVLLATNHTGVVTTVANDIVAACTLGGVSYDAAIGAYLKAEATNGNGTGILNALGPQQLTHGEGGLYALFLGSGGSGGLTWTPLDAWAVNYFQAIIDGTAYASGSTVRAVVVANGIAYPFEIPVSDLDFGIEKAGGSIFVGPNDAFQVSGTYTLSYSAGAFLLTRTASAASDQFVLPVNLEQRSTTDKGKIVTGVKLVYTVATATLEDVIPVFYKVPVPADNAAITPATMAFTYDTAHDSAGERGDHTGAPEKHTMTCTFDAATVFNAGELMNIQVNVDGDAGPTGAFIFYGAQVLFSTEEDY